MQGTENGRFEIGRILESQIRNPKFLIGLQSNLRFLFWDLRFKDSSNFEFSVFVVLLFEGDRRQDLRPLSWMSENRQAALHRPESFLHAWKAYSTLLSRRDQIET